ncbi:hybrid sensor histidine kinase/response regulator [Aquabacterium sp.]|uniref:hybrid sensor histidine kinase/response regulator n=1 Tax=Aquabacterium sp. TaxID=1872578 RepID=UPI002B87D8F8|nr:ATP-binding protein [Aquabacterium sp.]HSW06887.1 ATP-binding protein [Aquabacterium sp.]
MNTPGRLRARLGALLAVLLLIGLAGGLAVQRPSSVWSLGVLSLLAVLVGLALGWTVMARQAAERRITQARAQRLQHFYTALSQTHQRVVRETDAQRLFDEICRICVETGHARLSCVNLVEDGSFVRQAASAGPAAAFFAGLPERRDLASGDTACPITLQALQQGVPALSADYPNDPRAAAWRSRALAQGLRTMAVFPLCRGGRVIGALGLYADVSGFFDEAVVQLVQQMCGDLSFALDGIDREAARVQALREAEAGYARFSQLFHRAPITTVIVALADQRVFDINDIGCARYGVAREEIIGHAMLDLGIGLLEADRQRMYEELRLNRRVHNLPVRVRTRPGELRDALLNGEVIDYLGEPCLLAMSLDVTELRSAEQARQAQAEAEAASRAKTEFLSRMSHELRTPLNAVLGFSKLLQEDVVERLSERQQAQLDHIGQAGSHLLALINDVLDVARIEAGRLQIEPRALALEPLLDEALRMTEALASEHGVSMHLQAPAGAAPTWVLADPIRLRQVLINLLSNAVKYNRPDGTVRLLWRTEDAAVQIEVIDNGLGMSAEQLAHLYEPFNRLGRERGDIEGTGIGLSLTRQLVRLMHGRLALDSQLGQGTRVSLQLPMAPAAPAPPPVAAAAHDSSAAGVVLYIEDNPVNLLLVEQLLARWPDVRLLQAEDGGNGIALARSLQPDVVLLDMHLPDIDGLQVLRTLRADPATQGLAIVALSASAMPDEVAQAREAGATDYWTKPLDFDAFLAKLHRLLKASQKA